MCSIRKLVLFLAPCPKIKFKQILILTVNPEMLKVLQENEVLDFLGNSKHILIFNPGFTFCGIFNVV